MLLNILQCLGQPPTIKNHPAPNVSSAEVEKSWVRGSREDRPTASSDLVGRWWQAAGRNACTSYPASQAGHRESLEFDLTHSTDLDRLRRYAHARASQELACYDPCDFYRHSTARSHQLSATMSKCLFTFKVKNF